MRRAQASLTVFVLLLLAAPAAGQELTIYSSLPLHGPQAVQGKAINRGAELALRDAGGVAAGHPIRFVPLAGSRRFARGWVPEAVYANARRAADDRRARGYIGEFNSGASAVSIPPLNEAGILQVSPSNTYIGLTRGGAATFPGDPEKYYPTGSRTYGRLVPTDAVLARGTAALLQMDGIDRVLVVHDGETYGRGMALRVAAAARARGVRVTSVRRLTSRGANARRLAARARRADAVFYGGITDTGAVRLWRALARVRRSLRLYAGEGVAESAFTARIPGGVARRTQVVLSTLDRSAYPAAGQAVLDRLGAGADVYGLHGYEAMAVILDAIGRAGPGATRERVVEAFFATRDRDSVLGRYAIDRHGDTTLRQVGVYGIAGGRLAFSGALDAGS